MVFQCYLCEKESVYMSWFCDDCRKIKNIMNCYGKEGVLSILNKTCLRDNKQVGYKIDTIKKEVKVVSEQPKLEQMVLRKKNLIKN